MTNDCESYIVVFKVSNGMNIKKAYNEKRLLIPIEENMNGGVRVSLFNGNLSKDYKIDMVKQSK